ncbi:MAG TPA: TIGR03067 domain-containing protein [Labilithrix sp.]
MLDGKWIPIEAELGGAKMAAGALSSFELAIRNGTYEVPGDVGRIDIHEGTSPPSMDVIGTDGPNKGKTFPAIYELDQDLLTICYDLAGKERPTSFATASGTKQFLVKYKRKAPTVTPPA